MKKLLFILTLICSNFIFGQNINFLKSYGNTGYDYGKDIKQTLDTGYIATGSSSSFLSENADMFLLKVDSMGNFKWSHNYGGSGSDWGEKVILTHDSSFTIAGYTNSYGAGGFDFYMVHTNHSGEPIWEKTYGGSDWDKAYSLVQLEDSGFVLVGETYSYGAGGMDIYIVRTDKFGDTIWTQTYGGLSDDYANDVILDGDSIVVVGGTNSFGAGMTDGIILKYHIDGTLGWVKYVGKERDDYFTSIVKNPTDEYFLGGSRLYYFDETGWLDDFWLYNISSDGTTLIADTSIVGGSHEVEVIYDLVVDNTDNIFFCGETKSFGYALIDLKKDAYVGRFDNDYYPPAYVQNFGAQNDDIAFGIDYCYDNGVVVVGQLYSGSTGGTNMFILRVDKYNTKGRYIVVDDTEYTDITLSIQTDKTQSQFIVYPTLFNESIQIEGINTDTHYEIYTMSGVKVKAGLIENSSIETTEITASGMYILNIIYDKKQYSYKLIKR